MWGVWCGGLLFHVDPSDSDAGGDCRRLPPINDGFSGESDPFSDLGLGVAWKAVGVAETSAGGDLLRGGASGGLLPGLQDEFQELRI